MRKTLAVVLIVAAVGFPGVVNAACNWQLTTKTGPTGITLQVSQMNRNRQVHVCRSEERDTKVP
jgi:hypothetical protein